MSALAFLYFMISAYLYGHGSALLGSDPEFAGLREVAPNMSRMLLVVLCVAWPLTLCAAAVLAAIRGAAGER